MMLVLLALTGKVKSGFSLRISVPRAISRIASKAVPLFGTCEVEKRQSVDILKIYVVKDMG